jgi:hypothetical protein
VIPERRNRTNDERSGEITRTDSPLYVVEAKITQDGKVRATATGKFLEKPTLFGNPTL